MKMENCEYPPEWGKIETHKEWPKEWWDWLVVVESDIPKCDDVHVKKLSKLPSSCSIFFLTLNLVLRLCVQLTVISICQKKTVSSILIFFFFNLKFG
jgi:hypothetical protein